MNLIVYLALSCILDVPNGNLATNPSGVRTIWGICVGIESYTGLPIPARPFARQDAGRVREFLVRDNGMRAPADQVWLFTDRPETLPHAKLASAENLREALEKIAESANPDDLLFLFLRIAALPEKDELRYLGCNATSDTFHRTTLLASELSELLNAIPCHWTCSYLDIAYEGPAQAMGISQAASDALKANPFSGLAGPRRSVVSANDGKFPAPSDDRKQAGLFAEVLLEGLAGRADQEGGEPDGWITAGEIRQFIEIELPKRAQRAIGNDTDAKPRFWGSGDLTHLCLVRNAAAIPEIERQIGQLQQLFQNGTISESQRNEGERLLSVMPHFAAERKLRQGYRSLLEGLASPADIDRLSQEAVASRNIDPAVAKKFADALLEARDLINYHYVRPAQGNVALRAGIDGLYRQFAETIPPALAKPLDALDQLPRDEVISLLMKVRIHLGNRADQAGSEVQEPAQASDKDPKRAQNPDPARDVALEAMFASLDPHSRYIPKSEIESDRRSVDGEFAGLGLQVAYNSTSRTLEVHSPVLGSPAYRAGIRAGDQIVAIDGADVSTMGEEQALEQLRGKKGASVRLTIRQPDGERSERSVKFADVKLETVVGMSRKPDHSWNFWLDPDKGIAYIRINSFDYNTADDFRRELRKLNQEKHVSGLVLDLRFNRGGVRKTAIDVAGLFVQGEIVTIRTRAGDEVRSGRSFFRFDIPVAVLINGESASSSEIVAAAIADHDRGIVVGERSFGKGSSQEILPLKIADGAVRLTTASLVRPNGKSLHKVSANSDSWGITPEPQYLVPMPREDAQRLLSRFHDQEMIRDQPPDLQEEMPVDPQLMRAVEALISRQKPTSKAD